MGLIRENMVVEFLHNSQSMFGSNTRGKKGGGLVNQGILLYWTHYFCLGLGINTVDYITNLVILHVVPYFLTGQTDSITFN